MVVTGGGVPENLSCIERGAAANRLGVRLQNFAGGSAGPTTPGMLNV